MALVSENHVNLIVVVSGFGGYIYVYPKHVYTTEVKLSACLPLDSLKNISNR